MTDWVAFPVSTARHPCMQAVLVVMAELVDNKEVVILEKKYFVYSPSLLEYSHKETALAEYSRLLFSHPHMNDK